MKILFRSSPHKPSSSPRRRGPGNHPHLPACRIPACAGMTIMVAMLTACTTLTATQKNCFNTGGPFPAQAACIKQNVAENRSLRGDPLVDEYVLTADQLARQVQRGAITDADARLKLTRKLNEIRERDIAEQANQAAIFNTNGPGPSHGTFTDCGRTPGIPACLSY